MIMEQKVILPEDELILWICFRRKKQVMRKRTCGFILGFLGYSICSKFLNDSVQTEIIDLSDDE